MFWIYIILVYLLGAVASFGVATWIYERSQLPYAKHLQPNYLKSWHNPFALVVSCFSWLGVIVFASVAKQTYGSFGFRYNYKKLWEQWNKNTSNL